MPDKNGRTRNVLETTCATCGAPLKLTGQARANALRRGRAYCPNGECGKAGQAVRSAAAQVGRQRARISGGLTAVAGAQDPAGSAAISDPTRSKVSSRRDRNSARLSPKEDKSPLAKLAADQKKRRARLRVLSPAEEAKMAQLLHSRAFKDFVRFGRSPRPDPGPDVIIDERLVAALLRDPAVGAVVVVRPG